MGKKFIISEDERNRILGLHETAKNNYGTVISEQYAGVAFGAEQNGLKIKKMETKEQAVGAPVAPQSKTFTPQNVQKIYDMASELFKRGDKDGFFTVDTLPTLMFKLNMGNADSMEFYNTPIEVWTGFPGVPLVIRKLGDLSIKYDPRAAVGGQKLMHEFSANTNAMAPIQKEPEAIMAAKNFGDVFGDLFPEDVTSKVLINTYKTMTEQNKNNLMAFLQRTNPELDTYKQKIKSTLGLA